MNIYDKKNNTRNARSGFVFSTRTVLNNSLNQNDGILLHGKTIQSNLGIMAIAVLGITILQFIWIALAGYSVAHAQTGFAISHFNNDSNTGGGTSLGTAISGGRYKYGQELGNQILGTSATSTVYLSASGGLSSITVGVKIECYNDNTYSDASYNASCSSANATTVIGSGGVGKALFSFSTPLTFDRTKYYRLGIGCNSACSGGTNQNITTYGSDTDFNIFQAYPQGIFAERSAPNTSPTLGLTDMYFDITSDTPFGLVSLGITQAMIATSTTQSLHSGYFADCEVATSTSFWSNIAGSFGCVLFNPSDASMNYVGSAIDEFEQTFPFVVFFGTKDIVEEAISTYDDTGNTLTLSFPMINGDLSSSTETITVMSPTMLQDRIGETYTNWWYNIILMLATVLLAWGIFKVIYHPH